MSRQNSSTLKQYFQTGLIPTQDNFAALIESSLNFSDAGINSALAGQIVVQSQLTKPISGTVTTANSSATVVGVDTKFLTDLTINNLISIAGVSYTIAAVASDTSFTISPPFAALPAPIANNVPAFVDVGVSLSMMDALGNLNMQLANGIMNIPSAITTNTLTAHGVVVAANFCGSGASLSGIPVSAITGTFTPEQLPEIPASKITGLLSTAQIPSIPANQITGQFTSTQLPDALGLFFYAPTPCISDGGAAQLNWQANPDCELQLDYVNLGELVSVNSHNPRLAKGVGQYEVNLIQSTLFTLTISANNLFIAQRQLWIEIIPTVIQKAMQLQFEGYSTEISVGLLARRYNLISLSVANVTALTQALKRALFPLGDIYQYIPAYYIALYGTGSFTDPFMTAMFDAESDTASGE